MLIKIKTLTGNEVELDIEPDSLVETVKKRLEEKEDIPPEQQRLIFSGKQLQDGKKVSDYNVEAGSIFHLVMQLRGGAR